MPQAFAIHGVKMAARDRSAGGCPLLARIFFSLSEIHEGDERPRCFCVGSNIGCLKAHPEQKCDDFGESLGCILWNQRQCGYLRAHVRQPVESGNRDGDACVESRTAGQRVDIFGHMLETVAYLLLKGMAFGDALDESLREMCAVGAEVNG